MSEQNPELVPEADGNPWPEEGANVEPNKSPEERIDALLAGDIDTEELPEQHKTQQPIVVGMGASAGGLEALTAFFETIPPDTGLTFVVVTHLSPDHKSVMDELLQRHTRMPVIQVLAEEVNIKPNHIYVIPPNRQLVLSDSHLFSQEFEGPRAGRAPIDIFFRSLAAMHADPVAILLTGGGTDGALGLRSVKEAGGLVMVQDPAEALHDSMPRTAISTGVVDLVLPVRDIAHKLVELNRRRVQVPTDPSQLSAEQQDALQRILTHLQARSGHDFRAYKQSTVLRRIQRRMQITGYETLEGYLLFMRQNPDEAQSLLGDLLIGVTNFFRDEESWQQIEETIIPDLFTGRSRDDVIRVWSVGCSTGEEAYTLAILLSEYAATLDAPPQFQVFATDLDEGALAKAREGFYPDAIAADVSAERLQRFFNKEGAYYRVRREVRDSILFAAHSVLRDPPFSRLDLIVCRNLLIYLQRPLQDTLFEVFYYALRPGGYLFLGNSETADSAGDLFLTVDKKHRLYRSRSWTGQQPAMPTLPLLAFSPRRAKRIYPVEQRVLQGESRADKILYEQTLEEYGPPSILVDDESNIIRLSGTAGRYLQHPDGPPTTNLIRLIRPEFQFELRSGLFQAFEKGVSSVSLPLMITMGNREQRVFISVWPRLVTGEQRLALIVFMEDQAYSLSTEQSRDREDGTDKPTTQRLEEEVRHLRDRLQATIEEYETSNEELKAANEELQSINEEYRSTTEELETSKEELQSVNEELETVNNELKGKLDEISRAHSDLQNLMTATEIATLFLDRDLRVQSYTDYADEIFNIMKSDRGRPIEHLTHRLDYPQLGDDARRVLRTLVPTEREVKRAGGGWYLARLRPYRTLDDRIEGVVLSFINVTLLKEAEQEARRSREVLDLALALAHVGWGIFNVETSEVTWDERGRAILGFEPEELVTIDKWFAGLHPDDFSRVREAYEAAVRGERSFDAEFRYRRPDDGEMRTIYAAGILQPQSDGASNLVVDALRDVTDERRAADTLREARENLQLSLWSADLGWSVIDLETGTLELDARARIIAGFLPERPLAWTDFLALVHPDDLPLVQADFEARVAGEKDGPLEYRIIRPDGEERIIRATGLVQRGSNGQPRRITGTLQEVTERRRDEAALRQLTGRLEQLVIERTAELQWANNELSAARDHFRTLFHSNPVPSLIYHPGDERIVDANEAFLRFFGLPPERVIGRAGDDLDVMLDGPSRQAIVAAVPSEGGLQNLEIQLPGAGGDARTILVSLEWIALEGSPYLLTSFIDITDRKRAEQQIRDLGSELTRVEEQERQRISGILHDDLQQRLYAIQIEVVRLREQLDKDGATDLKALLDRMNTLLPETIGITRDLSIDLSPPILHDEGLAEALEWVAARMNQQYGLQVEIDATESFPLVDQGLRIVLFQVARELLFNVVKHADIDHVNIKLRRDGDELVIEVKDGGRGFDAQQIATDESQGGRGLSMARQRLNLFGGRMKIESASGTGTRILVMAPLRPDHSGRVSGGQS